MHDNILAILDRVSDTYNNDPSEDTYDNDPSEEPFNSHDVEPVDYENMRDEMNTRQETQSHAHENQKKERNLRMMM